MSKINIEVLAARCALQLTSQEKIELKKDLDAILELIESIPEAVNIIEHSCFAQLANDEPAIPLQKEEILLNDKSQGNYFKV